MSITCRVLNIVRGHWEYRDGHDVALCTEEAGTGAGTKAKCPSRLHEGLWSAGEWARGGGHLPQPRGSNGLGGCTERHFVP